MTLFKGFKTEQAAKSFAKKNGGGEVVFDERTPKRKTPTRKGKAYREAVVYGGLDAEKYPYCVLWNETQM